ncbi:MAG: hypothetical protein A3F91_15225 [Flavobacteria bacterium RIFCSPLOWO2_12_FULL_35_11]|nr:MAG: hypothetical protein A3F91_15225 [Flavobacteria bacterium RIFCSPLOWO2_12_FULL_35_11]
MSHYMDYFTVEEGKQVQTDDLKFWKKNLKPTRYAKLVKEIEKVQKRISIRNGGDIVRGTDINNIIANKLR